MTSRIWLVRLCCAAAVAIAGHHLSFVKAWEKMEKKIGGRDGNIALSLNKPLGEWLSLLGSCCWFGERAQRAAQVAGKG